MDGDDEKTLAVLDNHVRKHIEPTITEHTDDLSDLKKEVRKHGGWWRLVVWTLGLLGAMQTPIGKKIVSLLADDQ